jgi:hypothetical protein
MKVHKGGSKEGREVKHPRAEGGKALRDGLKHLKEHHAETREGKPERPEHRRK